MIVQNFDRLLRFWCESVLLVLIACSFHLCAVEGEIFVNKPIYWAPGAIQFESGNSGRNVRINEIVPAIQGDELAAGARSSRVACSASDSTAGSVVIDIFTRLKASDALFT